MQKKLWIAAVLAAATVAALPNSSRAAVFVNISIAPPAIPVYEQPIAPGPDYLWTPGYWAWDPNVGDYYWVPGTWVAAPQPGYLWTPGYWAFDSGFYGWHAGYWGPHIGYYGGVNYGFVYFCHGFEGGYWNGGHFFYNTAYSRVNVTNVRNVYVHNVTVVNNVHTSFVGGNGLQNRPSPGEQAALRENHVQPTGGQMQHASFARQDRSQFASQNHGAPPAAALARPADSVSAFRQGAVAGRADGSYNAPNQQQRGFQSNGQQPGGMGSRGPARNGAQVQDGNRSDFGHSQAQQGFRGQTQPPPQPGYAQQPGRSSAYGMQNQQQPAMQPGSRPQTQAYPAQQPPGQFQPQPQRPGDAQVQRQSTPEARPQGHAEPSRPAGGGHEGGHGEGHPH